MSPAAALAAWLEISRAEAGAILMLAASVFLVCFAGGFALRGELATRRWLRDGMSVTL